VTGPGEASDKAAYRDGAGRRRSPETRHQQPDATDGDTREAEAPRLIARAFGRPCFVSLPSSELTPDEIKLDAKAITILGGGSVSVIAKYSAPQVGDRTLMLRSTKIEG
jgi:hypothetical protein